MIDLWLDDERDPKNRRIQELFNADASMVWVKTVDAAMARLRQGNVGFISLDHDLGTTATGYDLACWIEQRAFHNELPHLAWRVHSANTLGASAIRRAMESADRCWTDHERKASELESPY